MESTTHGSPAHGTVFGVPHADDGVWGTRPPWVSCGCVVLGAGGGGGGVGVAVNVWMP